MNKKLMSALIMAVALLCAGTASFAMPAAVDPPNEFAIFLQPDPAPLVVAIDAEEVAFEAQHVASYNYIPIPATAFTAWSAPPGFTYAMPAPVDNAAPILGWPIDKVPWRA